MVEERKKSIEAFYSKTNINEIKNIITLKEHIEDMKINIREYKNKIKKIEKEFNNILEKIENQNTMSKEKNKQEQINKILWS